MVILSYVSLVLCVHCYFCHCLNIVKVIRGQKKDSGEHAVFCGHFFLASCVYFATNYGWTF